MPKLTISVLKEKKVFSHFQLRKAIDTFKNKHKKCVRTCVRGCACVRLYAGEWFCVFVHVSTK
jgi:hypothetical protein